MLTVEDLIKTLKIGAEVVRKDFTDPKDDWDPQCMLTDKNGKLGMVLIPGFSNDREKDIAVEALCEVVRLSGAQSLAMLSSHWTVSYSADMIGIAQIMSGVTPEEHPDRREKLVITGFDIAMEDAIMTTSEIIRHKDQPPTLGEWKEPYGKQARGEMITPLLEAIKKNGEKVIKH